MGETKLVSSAIGSEKQVDLHQGRKGPIMGFEYASITVGNVRRNLRYKLEGVNH